jgi:hypothetical protein
MVMIGMGRGRCGFITLFMVLLALWSPLSAFASQACQTSEEQVFLCHAKEKTAAICYAKSSGLFTYRFFRGEKLEMIYPSDSATSGRDAFRFSSTPYSGGGEAHIRFRVGDYTYLIYDRNFRQPDGGLDSANGVAVRMGSNTVAHLRCDNDASIAQQAYNFMPKESFEELGDQSIK